MHTLQSLVSTHSDLTLPVGVVLEKLLKEHLNFEEPPILVSDCHAQSWGYQHEEQGNGDESDSNYKWVWLEVWSWLVASVVKFLKIYL